MILEALIKLLPAIIANTAPVFATKLLPRLDYPVDFNKRLRDGKRLFGSHKTWRGVITMILTSTLIGLFTVGLYYGVMIGVGVVLGDLLTSYIKSLQIN